MRTSELTTLSKSASCRGFQQDRNTQAAIARREQKRRDIDDINQFAKLLADLCPDYYGERVTNG